MRDWVNEHFEGRIFPFPRIYCADGFNLSVQAGRALYSTPRSYAAYYEAVEVGYPSAAVPEFMPYIDGGPDDEPTQTVYGYVPVEVVNAVIESHGGIKE